LSTPTRFTAENAEIAEESRNQGYGFNPRSDSRLFSASSARSAVKRVSSVFSGVNWLYRIAGVAAGLVPDGCFASCSWGFAWAWQGTATMSAG